jgi:hypothetical protein
VYQVYGGLQTAHYLSSAPPENREFCAGPPEVVGRELQAHFLGVLGHDAEDSRGAEAAKSQSVSYDLLDWAGSPTRDRLKGQTAGQRSLFQNLS